MILTLVSVSFELSWYVTSVVSEPRKPHSPYVLERQTNLHHAGLHCNVYEEGASYLSTYMNYQEFWIGKST